MNCQHKWIDYGMTAGFREVIYWCELCGALKLKKTMEPLDFTITYPKNICKKSSNLPNISDFATKAEYLDD